MNSTLHVQAGDTNVWDMADETKERFNQNDAPALERLAAETISRICKEQEYTGPLTVSLLPLTMRAARNTWHLPVTIQGKAPGLTAQTVYTYVFLRREAPEEALPWLVGNLQRELPLLLEDVLPGLLLPEESLHLVGHQYRHVWWNPPEIRLGSVPLETLLDTCTGELLTECQALLEQKRTEYAQPLPDPAWISGTFSDLALTANLQTRKQVAVQYRLSVTAAWGESQVETVCTPNVPLPNILICTDPDRFHEEFLALMRPHVQEAFRSLMACMPVAEIPDGHFPQEVLNFVRNGKLESGRVCSQSGLAPDIGRRKGMPVTWAGGDQFRLLTRPYTRNEGQKPFSFDLAAYQKLRENQDAFLTSPAVAISSVAEVITFICVLGEMYPGVCPLTVALHGAGRLSWAINGEKSTLDADPEETVEHWMARLLAVAAEKDKVVAAQMDVWRAALQSLNKTELDILRYIYKTERTWYHDIVDHVVTPFSKAAVGRCLSGLDRMRVAVDGKAEPLYDTRLTDGKHGEFWLYRPNPNFPVSVLSEVAGRPYTTDDMLEMSPDDRDRWLLTEAVNAATADQRWTILSAFDSLPRTVFQRFVKRNTSRKFFDALEGADREYARLLVESTPGCKKLAAEIFGKERDPEQDEQCTECAEEETG